MTFFDYHLIYDNSSYPENENKIWIISDLLVFTNPLPNHITGLKLTSKEIIFNDINYLQNIEELKIQCTKPNIFIIENLKYLTKLKIIDINFPVTHDFFPLQLTELQGVYPNNYKCVLPNIKKIQFGVYAFDVSYQDIANFPNVEHISTTIKIKNCNYQNDLIKTISFEVQKNEYNFRIKLPSLEDLHLYVYHFSDELNKSLQYLIDNCVNLKKAYIVLGSSDGCYELTNISNYVISVPMLGKNINVIINSKFLTLRPGQRIDNNGVYSFDLIFPTHYENFNNNIRYGICYDNKKTLMTELEDAKTSNNVVLYIKCFGKMHTASDDEIKLFFKRKLLTYKICFDYLWFNTSKFLFNKLCKKTNMTAMLKSLIVDDNNLFVTATLINVNYLIDYCPELRKDIIIGLALSGNNIIDEIDISGIDINDYFC